MLLFRSLTVGLLAACAYMLADLPAVHTYTVRTVQVTQPPAAPTNHVTVVDVANSVEPANIPSLLFLRPGETISAINDRRTEAFNAATQIADAVHYGAQYLDLTVARGKETRRILVLVH